MQAHGHSRVGNLKDDGQKAPSWKRRVLLACLSTVISLCIVECILRLWDPVHLRLRGLRVVLPRHQTWVFENKKEPRLDKRIVHTKNSLGFRGPELPSDFDSRLTILAVGGSTTECLYLNDGKDWVTLLGGRLQQSHPSVWVNNAGIQGHSTFGHLALLKQVVLPLRPKIVLLLIGVNDYALSSMNHWDSRCPDAGACAAITRFSWLLRWSYLLSVPYAWSLHREAVASGVAAYAMHDGPFVLATLPTTNETDAVRESYVQGHRTRYLPGYRHRVMEIIAACRKAGVEPVLITQPHLLGSENDPETGVPLSTISMGGISGALFWILLEEYNGVLREVAAKENVFLIDLAHYIPKSSRYYYDLLHFSNEGSALVADAVSSRLVSWLPPSTVDDLSQSEWRHRDQEKRECRPVTDNDKQRN